MVLVAFIVGMAIPAGCARRDNSTVQLRPGAPTVVAVAPVLNLSNSADWDALKVTDVLASELQSFPGVAVIPVNTVVAALALTGRSSVETPQDAIDLARELGADATLVAAITEYQPYDPPIVGLILQWYPRRLVSPPPTRFDPVSASRQATEVAPVEYSDEAILAPLIQVQRVYNAADRELRKEIRVYANKCRRYDSSYGWRLHTQKQELFVRYCCRASIETMLLARDQRLRGPRADEAERWKQDGDA